MTEEAINREEQIADVRALLEGETPEVEEKEVAPTEDAGIETEEDGLAATPEKEEKTSDVEVADSDEDFDLVALAGESKIPIEELYETRVKFGEGRESVSLGELKDFYDDYHDESVEMHEKIDALKDLNLQGKAAQAAYDEYQPQMTAAENRMKELEGMWNKVDWEHIPEESQAEYQKFAQDLQNGYQMAKVQYENAETMMKDSQSQLGKIQETERRAQEDAWKEQAAQEWPQILADNPEWKDEAAAQAGMGNLYKVMEGYGLSEEEARQVTDHRLFRLARDAAAYQNANKVDIKKVRKAGKTLPGKRKVPASIKAKRAQRKALEAAKNGDMSDKVAAVAQLIS